MAFKVCLDKIPSQIIDDVSLGTEIAESTPNKIEDILSEIFCYIKTY